VSGSSQETLSWPKASNSRETDRRRCFRDGRGRQHLGRQRGLGREADSSARSAGAGWFDVVGVERVLFGSDAAAGDNLRPREAWAAFRRLPLTEKEFETIATNVAPYLR